MSRLRRFILAFALLALPLTEALAQHPQVRRGFWLNVGLGYGSADVSCDGCGNNDREGGFTGQLRLGGTLRPNILLGAELDGWAKDEGGTTFALGDVLAAVYVYPKTSGGLFLKGGAGFSSYTESNGQDVDGTGWALMGGLGYDVRVGRNISLTPEATFFFGAPGDIKDGNTTVATGFKLNVLALGLGVTFH